ncbi:hypothetical protein BT63DRAFT_484003 [Microthyrium microscopicum]|uniref:TPR-like protein n=1 Tax=Microthyrium microscopicum TaxID=703497 RepID=A0A6A6TUV2_9PEZI|nr:hypothetical protein BT63DRAFT_484003 [Microthyrium microscopicum]
MASHLQPPPVSKNARGHVRVTSEDRRRITALRRSTKGPLDEVDDPLSIASPTSPELLSPETYKTQSLSPRASLSLDVPKDFTFLLEPANFTPLSTPLLKHALSDSTSSLSLSDLLATGRFHTAAVRAASDLSALPPTADAATILPLWYVRLASLTLIHETTIAAQESKILGDLSSPFYRLPPIEDGPGEHIVPWGLRVLAVRLQALGFGEPRRGLMAYYLLASDAREAAARARASQRQAEMRLWQTRLRELGVLVASALVEMGEGQAAARHLRSLKGRGREEVGMEILTWLRMGDLSAAAACLADWENSSEGEDKVDEDGFVSKVLKALIATCEGEYAAVVKDWQALHDEYPDDVMILQNLAVCQMYTCEMEKSRDAFEKIIADDTAAVFPSLLFNMASLYELSSENAQMLKTELASRISASGPSGEERTKIELKL